MTSSIRCVLKLGSALGNVLLSTVGCFVLMRGTGLVVNRRDGSDTLAPFRGVGTPAGYHQMEAPRFPSVFHHQ